METRPADIAAEHDVKPDPILILGISERSGTNFLFHLLCRHPGCDSGGPLWENYLTLHLDQLVHYADDVYREWNPAWQVGEAIGPRDTLLADLGRGLVRYLNRQLRDPPATPPAAPRRLVAKTPSVRNLPYVRRVFAGSPLLVLVRDPPAVVESAYRSFDIGFEAGMRKWATAAGTILEWLERCAARQGDAPTQSERALLVRYEDLVLDNEATLRRIFRFLDLDPETYDYAAAAELPVIASSEVRQQVGQLHWQGVPKRADFAPTDRGSGWSTARQYRLAWLAGREAEALGYTVHRPKRMRALWALWHRVMDLTWHVARITGRVRRFVTWRLPR